MLLKILYDNCDGNGDKKCVRVFNFSAANCLQVFNTGRDSGGEGGGAAERQQGRKAAFASTNMCGGILVLSLFFKIFYLKHSLIANNDVKT
jgi:hypothetical protein